MKIYISGPMTGYPDYNRPAFAEAARELRAQGHEVKSPPEIAPYNPDWAWRDYMKEDVCALMECDEIYTLPGWEKSRGATIEVMIADALGIKKSRSPETQKLRTF